MSRHTKMEELLKGYFSKRDTIKIIERLNEMNYFHAPASTKHHGNYEGGLFDHSLEVASQLKILTDGLDLVWEDKRSPIIIGMFHDLCKVESYKPLVLRRGTSGVTYSDDEWEYNEDVAIPGHGDKSIILLSELMQLTEEEIYCIRWHMGAYEGKENWKYFDKAIRKYPNVLFTHTADMIASKIIGI